MLTSAVAPFCALRAVGCGLRINCGRGFRPRIVRSIYFALTGLNCVPGYSRGVAPGCDITTFQAFFVLRASVLTAHDSRSFNLQFEFCNYQFSINCTVYGGRGEAVTRGKWSVGEKNTVYGTHADAGDPRRWRDRQDAVCCGLRINCVAAVLGRGLCGVFISPLQG